MHPAADMQVKSEAGSSVRRKARAPVPPAANTPDAGSEAGSSCGARATPRISTEDGFKHSFKSYRLRGAYEKPWLADPAMRKTRWNNAIVCAWMLLGVVGAAVICFFSVWPYRNLSVRAALPSSPSPSPPPLSPSRARLMLAENQYCLVYEDDFATLDSAVWSREVQLDGFGSGSFDWTTADDGNAYVDAAGLHIVPTLTNETTAITNDQLYANFTLDLSADGSCTGKRNACKPQVASGHVSALE